MAGDDWQARLTRVADRDTPSSGPHRTNQHPSTGPGDRGLSTI